MMHNGRIIFDVSGEEKKALTVDMLIEKFSQTSGQEFANDRALLGN
jgi:putative ABC transport system ATP-binding protein